MMSRHDAGGIATIMEYEMNACTIALALLCLGTDSFRDASDATTVKAPPLPRFKVGQIFVVGNTRTKMNVILDQIDLFPGETIDSSDIRQAERNLERLRIFKNTPDGVVRSRIEVRDDPNNPISEYKDLIVSVEEDNTFHASIKHSVGLSGDWVIHFVLEERNFDPLCFPHKWEDFVEGRAFRGAGIAITLDLQIAIPIVPGHSPHGSLLVRFPNAP
jgi:outer membrane protein assembly factor BamA